MSRFYVLPSRPLLGEHFAGYLKALFPGLEWRGQQWGDLADVLAAVAAAQPDAYVVYRHELPEGEDLAAALGDGYGAAAGDEVIEIVGSDVGGAPAARHWRIGARAAA